MLKRRLLPAGKTTLRFALTEGPFLITICLDHNGPTSLSHAGSFSIPFQNHFLRSWRINPATAPKLVGSVGETLGSEARPEVQRSNEHYPSCRCGEKTICNEHPPMNRTHHLLWGGKRMFAVGGSHVRYLEPWQILRRRVPRRRLWHRMLSGVYCVYMTCLRCHVDVLRNTT